MIRVSKVDISFRAWAALPPSVVALVVAEDGKVSTWPRPTFPKGVCTGCGCTERDSCAQDFGEPCGWRDRARTRCTACPPAPKVRKARR